MFLAIPRHRKATIVFCELAGLLESVTQRFNQISEVIIKLKNKKNSHFIKKGRTYLFTVEL